MKSAINKKQQVTSKKRDYPSNSVLLTSYSKLLVVFVLLTSYFILPTPASAFTISKSMNNNLGLVGWWTFDGKDVAGGTIRDISGQGNHGIAKNIATSTFFTAGKIGQALNFDGVNDYVDARYSSVTDFKGAGKSFSASAWVRATNVDGGDGGIVGRWEDSNKFQWILKFETDTNDIKFSVHDGAFQIAESAANTIVNNIWTHIVGVADSGTLKVYVNGSLSGVTDTYGTITDIGTATVLVMGANSLLQTPEHWNGSIDDVRIYNRALSESEIKTIYNQGAGKFAKAAKDSLSNGLVGHWTFDGKDSDGGSVRDISGYGVDGQRVNMSTSTAVTEGKLGQALSFDGVDDYLNMPSISGLEGENLSVCGWFNPSSVVGNKWLLQQWSTNGPGLFASSANINWQVGSGATYRVSSTGNLFTVGKWQHLCGTAASTTLVLYYNGESVASGTTLIQNIANQRFSVAGPSEGGPTYFPGKVDDVRVYNRTLSAEEVRALYNQGVPKMNATPARPSAGSGLVGHWTFDGKDMANGVAKDVSGNGNNGNAISIATSTFYAEGKIGQGARFDGVNDYVVSMNNPISDYPFTLSTWIKAPTINGQYSAISYSSNAANTIYYSLGVNGNVPNQKLYSSSRSSISDENAFAGTTNLIPGQWYLITVVATSATDRKLYLNGVEDGTSSVSIPFVAGNNIAAGVVNRSSPFGYWPSSIDDARFYNRALSVGEIKQLYNQGR